MKKMLWAGAVLLLFVCSGCVAVHTSDGATGVPQPISDHPGYEANFTHKGERIEGTSNVSVLFWVFAWGTAGFADNSQLSFFSFLPSPENFARSAAVYAACQEHQVDTLLGTRYIVTTTDYFLFKTVSCEVAGFPAVMTGITKKKPYVTATGELHWLSEEPVVVK